MEQETPFKELIALYKEKALIDSIKGIIKDGVINPAEYNKQTTKVLFIAKEHNPLKDPHESGDYREWWNDDVRYPFSHRLSEWAHGIINDFPPYEQIKHSDKKDALRSIAFINLKKTTGKSSSDIKVLSSYVNASRNLLLDQIREIAPTIIVCCLRYDTLPKQLFDFKDMRPALPKFGYQYWKNIPVLNFYHPSARKNKVSLYEELTQLVRFPRSNP